MKRIDYIICFFLSLSALVSRIPFVEKFQSFWDGPQYTIGIVRYSFDQQTPASPGYPIFIGLGKFFHIFIQDPHTSLIAVTVFASVMGAITLYIVGLKMFHRFVGLAAAIIFLTGSTFYFFSIAPHAYDLLVTTTPLFAYSVYRIFVQKKQEGLLLGLTIGICIGLRPQEIIQLGILFLLGFLTLTIKEKIKASIIFVAVTLSWFIPVVKAVGFINYFQFMTLTRTALLSGSILQHAEIMLKGFLLSFGVAAGFLLYYINKLKKLRKLLLNQNRTIIFYSAWIIPGILFNLLMRSDAVGYQFSYLTALLLVISYAIWQSTRKYRFLYIMALICIALFNLYWFFYDRDPNFTKPYRPVSYHYSELRKNDIKFGNKVIFIQKKYSPNTTLVFTSTDFWRPYMYHLRNYHIFSPAAITTKESRFIYQKFYAFDWNMQEVYDKNLSIIIPNYITTVVFTDDDAKEWIKDYQLKSYILPGNSEVASIKVQSGDKIAYSYHKITIER